MPLARVSLMLRRFGASAPRAGAREVVVERGGGRGCRNHHGHRHHG
jgi:hypothetical protein